MRQQSAVNAGTGGFDVVVNGHTHLKGGVITTEGASGASQLITQTLSHETLANKDVVDGRSWSVSVSVSNADTAKGALAGSAVGYARIETDQRSDTRSGVLGNLVLTRPDLQSQAVANLRAAERQPYERRLTEVQAQLNYLYGHEPPRCFGCYIELAAPGVPDGALTASRAGAASVRSSLVATKRSSAGEKPTAGEAEWLDWRAAVDRYEAEQSKLQQRIAAVDAKVYQAVGTLARGSNNDTDKISALHQPLLQTFDRSKATQELKDGVALTAAFGKAAFKAVGDYTAKQAKDIRDACDKTKPCDTAKDWEDGGKYKVLLHGIVGAISGGRAGALATMTAEAATPYLKQVIVAAGVAEGSATYDALMLAAKSAVGGGLGGTAGAAVAFNADANNRQLHPDEGRYIKGKARAWAQKQGISENQAEQELTRGALYANDLSWNRSYAEWTPDQVSVYRQAAAYLEAEARRENFAFINLEGQRQTGFASTPEQYRNGEYLMQMALRDPDTRQMYVSKAALDLGKWDGLKFAAKMGLPAARGLGAGVEDQLTAYAKLLSPEAFRRLADAAQQAYQQGVAQTLSRVFNSTLAGAESAAMNTMLAWMQSDSERLGHAAGKVLGAALVDAVATASGIAVIKNGERIAQGLTEVQAATVARIERLQVALKENRKALDALPDAPPRVLNGMTVSPKLTIEPAAGWDYAPSVVANAKSENLYWSHWAGHQAEVRLASDLADQGQLVVRWGDKIGTNGADVISVNPVTGQVSLWDTKLLTADKSIKMSGTFDFVSAGGDARLANLLEQADRAIRAAKLSPAIEAKAIADLQAKNFFANTVGAGNARNSVPMKFCGAKPC